MNLILVIAVVLMLCTDAYLWATGKPISPMSKVFTDATLLLYMILYLYGSRSKP